MAKPIHPLILEMLQGPKVPARFESDGCSCSPDGIRHWPCRIHDYEAEHHRQNWAMIQSYDPDKKHQKKMISVLVGEFYQPNMLTRKQANELWLKAFESCQSNLRHNLRIVLTYRINSKGELVKKKWWNPRRWEVLISPRLYYGVTSVYKKWAKEPRGY